MEEKPDYILHAAGIASPMYYRRFPLETIDVATLKRHAEHARPQPAKSKSQGLVYFSSSEIYGDPDMTHVPTAETYNGNVSSIGPRACYDESKRLGETLCSVYHQQFGTRVMIVRPFNVYGPGMKEADYRVLPNFANCIKAGKALNIYGSGHQTRTFCFIEDAIVGFLQVLLLGRAAEKAISNIGNPAPEISMRGLVGTDRKVSPEPGRMQRFIPYPGKLSRPDRADAALPRHQQGRPKEMSAYAPRCRSGRWIANLSRVDRARVYGNGSLNESRQKYSGSAMNYVDKLVHDWGWWNRGYTRLLIRSRGYRLVSMARTLPAVETVSELTRHENGALLRLEPRQSLQDLKPPKVALGEHFAGLMWSTTINMSSLRQGGPALDRLFPQPDSLWAAVLHSRFSPAASF